MADVFEIAFDGGSKGNPGKGYGSFEIRRNGTVFDRQIEVQFGDRLTNNQAEYMSLIGALRAIVNHPDVDPASATVRIYGDSKLVISQISGVWKVKNANMIPLWQETMVLLKQIGTWEANWHDRSNSVRVLGH